MGNIRKLIETLTDIGIDLEGEDETILAGLRFELEDMDDDDKVNEHLKEFEQDWLNDIQDTNAKSSIITAIKEYRGESGESTKADNGKELREKFANLNYQIQSADDSWIKANPQEFQRMKDELHSLDNKIRDMEIATEIIRQLGGFSVLKIMTGAYNFIALKRGVSFRLKHPPANYVKIELTGADLYNIEVGRIRGTKYTMVDNIQGAYSEQMKPFLEKATGLTFTMPRVIFPKQAANGAEMSDAVKMAFASLNNTLDEIAKDIKSEDDSMDFAEFRFALVDKTDGNPVIIKKVINDFWYDQLENFEDAITERIKGALLDFQSIILHKGADGMSVGTGVFQGKENWRITAPSVNGIGIYPKDRYTKEQAEKLFTDRYLNKTAANGRMISIPLEEKNRFVDYVYDFYDGEYSRSSVQKAVDDYLRSIASEEWGGGDSFDREKTYNFLRVYPTSKDYSDYAADGSEIDVESQVRLQLIREMFAEAEKLMNDDEYMNLVVDYSDVFKPTASEALQWWTIDNLLNEIQRSDRIDEFIARAKDIGWADQYARDGQSIRSKYAKAKEYWDEIDKKMTPGQRAIYDAQYKRLEKHFDSFSDQDIAKYIQGSIQEWYDADFLLKPTDITGKNWFSLGYKYIAHNDAVHDPEWWADMANDGRHIEMGEDNAGIVSRSSVPAWVPIIRKAADGDYLSKAVSNIERLHNYMVEHGGVITIHGSSYGYFSHGQYNMRVVGNRGAIYNIVPFFPEKTAADMKNAKFFSLIRQKRATNFAITEDGGLVDIVANGTEITGGGHKITFDRATFELYKKAISENHPFFIHKNSLVKIDDAKRLVNAFEPHFRNNQNEATIPYPYAAHGMDLNRTFTYEKSPTEKWEVEYEWDRKYPIVYSVTINGEEVDIDDLSQEDNDKVHQAAYEDYIDRMVGAAEYSREFAGGGGIGKEAPNTTGSSEEKHPGPPVTSMKLVTFTKKNNRAIKIEVKVYPSMSIYQIDNPRNERFPYVVGQVLNMGHRTWACNNGWLVNDEDPCPEKKIFGMRAKDIPEGHPLRHLYPSKFRANGGGVMTGGGKISDLDDATQNLINEIINYLETDFGGKVTSSRNTGSMKDYISFRKKGGYFYEFNDQFKEVPKYSKKLEEKFGYGVFMDWSKIDIKLLGHRKLLRGGPITPLKGTTGRDKMVELEKLIMDRIDANRGTQIKAKIITTDKSMDTIQRYAKSSGGNSVLQMMHGKKRYGRMLYSVINHPETIVSVQFYDEAKDRTYADELALAQKYFQQNRHPNLWDDLAKDYDFTEQQLEDFRRATDHLSHFEAWQKASDYGLPKIEGHKTITMQSAGMPEYAQQQLKDAIDQKKNYSYHWDCGWDCSVSTSMGTDGIYRGWFSQEFKGTGNGHYWLLISPTQAIFAEHD